MAISAEYPQFPRIDVEDYLTLDTTSQTAKYEYLEGEVSMLAGGSNNHALIAANMIMLLGNVLKKSPCCVYSSDVRVKLAENTYVHPDVTVACDERDSEKTDNIEYPRILVEVLSPSTEYVDRGKKLLYYRACSTVQEYILIDSRTKFVEVHSRKGKGWMSLTYGSEGVVEIASLNLTLSLEDIYEKTRL